MLSYKIITKKFLKRRGQGQKTAVFGKNACCLIKILKKFKIFDKNLSYIFITKLTFCHKSFILGIDG